MRAEQIYQQFNKLSSEEKQRFDELNSDPHTPHFIIILLFFAIVGVVATLCFLFWIIIK